MHVHAHGTCKDLLQKKLEETWYHTCICFKGNKEQVFYDDVSFKQPWLAIYIQHSHGHSPQENNSSSNTNSQEHNFNLISIILKQFITE